MDTWSRNDQVYDVASMGGWSVDNETSMGGFFEDMQANLEKAAIMKGTQLASSGMDKIMGAVGLNPPPPPPPISYRIQPQQQSVMMPPPPPPAAVYNQQMIDAPLFDAKTKKMLMIGGAAFAALLGVVIIIKMLPKSAPATA